MVTRDADEFTCSTDDAVESMVVTEAIDDGCDVDLIVAAPFEVDAAVTVVVSFCGISVDFVDDVAVFVDGFLVVGVIDTVVVPSIVDVCDVSGVDDMVRCVVDLDVAVVVVPIGVVAVDFDWVFACDIVDRLVVEDCDMVVETTIGRAVVVVVVGVTVVDVPLVSNVVANVEVDVDFWVVAIVGVVLTDGDVGLFVVVIVVGFVFIVVVVVDGNVIVVVGIVLAVVGILVWRVVVIVVVDVCVVVGTVVVVVVVVVVGIIIVVVGVVGFCVVVALVDVCVVDAVVGIVVVVVDFVVGVVVGLLVVVVVVVLQTIWITDVGIGSRPHRSIGKQTTMYLTVDCGYAQYSLSRSVTCSYPRNHAKSQPQINLLFASSSFPSSGRLFFMSSLSPVISLFVRRSCKSWPCFVKWPASIEVI